MEHGYELKMYAEWRVGGIPGSLLLNETPNSFLGEVSSVATSSLHPNLYLMHISNITLVILLWKNEVDLLEDKKDADWCFLIAS